MQTPIPHAMDSSTRTCVGMPSRPAPRHLAEHPHRASGVDHVGLPS